MFFGQDQDNVDLKTPYIVGFEYSRERNANNQTEGVLDDLEFNLYRHPEVQGLPEEPKEKEDEKTPHLSRPPYSQKHDVYSLGVILLEIGLLKSALEILKDAEMDQQYGSHSAQKFSAWLIEKEIPKLGRLMGTTYRDATMHCLTGSFASDLKMTAETGLYTSVLRSLAKCYAG